MTGHIYYDVRTEILKNLPLSGHLKCDINSESDRRFQIFMQNLSSLGIIFFFVYVSPFIHSNGSLKLAIAGMTSKPRLPSFLTTTKKDLR